jgi:hypothetical protein
VREADYLGNRETGARPVEDRVPCGCERCGAPPLTDEDLAFIRRRREAEASAAGGRWRVGGSPSTGGRTIYRGNQFVGLIIDPDVCARLVRVANQADQSDRP